MKNRVRQLREEQGLTQKQLGEKVNVSRQAINAVETGKFDPSLWLAYDIAQLFNKSIEEVFDFKERAEMRWLKNPMANAVYVALITAIYAAIFIVSSEFVMSYENLLSDSGWASFIISQNMKFVGIGMIGVAIIVDTLSALRRKRYDEYQIVLLEKVFLFNGLFTAVLFPLSLVVLILAPMYFVETIFALILFQWGVMAITELLYLITNYKV